MSGSNVIRLPVQHKQRPRCPGCDREITLDEQLTVAAAGFEHLKLLSVTFALECECGQRIALRKTVKR
jgi:transposase-like protein